VEAAAAPAAGLGALRPLFVLQLFAPARGRAASLDGCALPPLRKLPITGGLGVDRRKPAWGRREVSSTRRGPAYTSPGPASALAAGLLW